MTADVIPGATWSTLAAAWDTSGADWNTPVAERLVELAELRPGMAVLDVGCGAGAATLAAAQVIGDSGFAVGVDSAGAMVTRARYDARDRGIKNVLFALEEATQLSYSEHTFDAVISSMVVSYLPYPAKALHSWAHLLKGGGTLAFTWVMGDDPAWQPVLRAVDKFLPPEHTGWTASRKWWTVQEAEALLPRDMTASTVIEPFTTRYDNADHFWESSWTQAPAIAWSHIPESQRDDARAAAFAVLAGLSARDGSLERTRTVCYTVGRLSSSATVPAQANGA
jgi:ubiquinone/menaquinone biosynthesis C-methylase UbiE